MASFQSPSTAPTRHPGAIGPPDGVVFVRHDPPKLGITLARCSSRAEGLLYAARGAVYAARRGHDSDAVTMEEIALRMALHGGL